MEHRQQEVSHAYRSLSHQGVASIGKDREKISIFILDNGAKFKMVTLVYQGDNYIPSSIRKGLKQASKLHQKLIKTFFILDEDQYQITLNYLGKTEGLDLLAFRSLFLSFETSAQRWREFFDDQDRQDLVHVTSF